MELKSSTVVKRCPRRRRLILSKIHKSVGSRFLGGMVSSPCTKQWWWQRRQSVQQAAHIRAQQQSTISALKRRTEMRRRKIQAECSQECCFCWLFVNTAFPVLGQCHRISLVAGEIVTDQEKEMKALFPVDEIETYWT